MGDLVGHGSQEPSNARHPLVPDHHELHIFRLGQLADPLGGVSFDGPLLDRDVLGSGRGDLLELDGADQWIAHMDERDRAGVDGGERVGLADGFGRRPRAVRPRQDPHVRRGGISRTGAAGGVHDQEVAGRVMRDPVGHAAESEPGRLPHAAVADDDQVGSVLDRGREDGFPGCPLDQFRDRIDLLRTRRLRRLVEGGLERLPRDAEGVERPDEHEGAVETFRELLRHLDGDRRGR